MALLIEYENKTVLDDKFRLTIPAKIVRERSLCQKQKVFLRPIDGSEDKQIILDKPGKEDCGWFYVVELKTCGRNSRNLRLVIPKEMRTCRLFGNNNRRIRLVYQDNKIYLQKEKN